MATNTRGAKLRNTLTRLAKYLVLTAACSLFLLPLGIMVQKSLEGRGLADYLVVLTKHHLFRNFVNSSVVTVVTIMLVLVTTSLAAYAFSKMRFRFKNVLYYYVLCAIMIPTASILIPIFHIIRDLRLINNILSLVGPYTAIIAPFNLLILRNFMDDMPDEILESAHIDGCNSFQLFSRIAMPLCTPALLVVIIWTFLNSWNEFIMALIFLSKSSSQTLTVIPTRFKNTFMLDLPKMYASLTIIITPVVVLYLLLQRYFQEGLTAGALKG